MDIPESFKKGLVEGRVIPFVGAGVSRAVLNREGKPLFPNWKELLLLAANRLTAETHQKEADYVQASLELQPPKYLDAAETARGKLGAQWFDLLKEVFKPPFESADIESLELARKMWGLGSDLLITTNYDPVLRWASPRKEDLASWDVEAIAEQAQALADGMKNPTVWHLHGHIDNAEGIILTPDGYSRLYPGFNESETRFQAALETLRHFMASRSFLFIGFSLDDPGVVSQLRDVHDLFKGTGRTHYALVRQGQEADIQARLPGVTTITYADHGKPLLEILDALGSARSAPPPPPTPKEAPRTVGDYDPRKRPFFVPFLPRRERMVGRGESLKRVREQLLAGHTANIGQTALLQGLGGLGKTQLAVEYAHTYGDHYPQGVIWLTMDQDIDAQLVLLSDKAGWVSPLSDHKYKLDTALQRLKSFEGLVILDNLEGQEPIKKYLPDPSEKRHVLVTSRIEQHGFTMVGLNTLGPEDALKLLVQEADREPDGEAELEAAQTIAKKLDGLPLALELAGAYLHRRQVVSWADYLSLLETNLSRALPKQLGSLTGHDADLFATLKISEEILGEAEWLKEILNLLTWSGAAPMGRSLMADVLGVDEVALIDALGLGVGLRILQKSSDRESYAVHRLVRHVRREELSLESQETWIETVCQGVGDWFEERREAFSNLPAYEAELDHLTAWQDLADQYAPSLHPRLIWLQAYPPFHWGRYREAGAWLEKALEAFQACRCDDEALEAHLLNDSGVIASHLNDFQRALTLHERGLSIRERIHGNEHLETAMSLGNVGSCHQSLGHKSKALEHLEKALAIHQFLLDPEDPRMADILNGLGKFYADIQNPRKALEYHEIAYGIRQRKLGEDHPNTAFSFHNVGGCFYSLKETSKAITFFRKALTIEKKQLGNQHPETVSTTGSLAMALFDTNERPEAMALVNEALARISRDHIHYDWLVQMRTEFLKETIRPGFRNPSATKKRTSRPKRKNKKKRRKR